MFRKMTLLTLALFCAFATPAFAVLPNAPTWHENVGFIDTDAYVSAPAEFLDFCNRYPEDCLPPSNGISRVNLDASHMRDLNVTNSDVNDTIFFNSDVDTVDYWDYPQDNIGDCEDFVIEKRKRLMDRGWPEDSLLITLVNKRVPDYAGRTGHAVLTVRTAQGDYVLDNDIRSAVPWTAAMRVFEPVMMQTQMDPKVWATVKPVTVPRRDVDSGSVLP
mgnify:CR=1 FL=1